MYERGTQTGSKNESETGNWRENKSSHFLFNLPTGFFRWVAGCFLDIKRDVCMHNALLVDNTRVNFFFGENGKGIAVNRYLATERTQTIAAFIL